MRRALSPKRPRRARQRCSEIPAIRHPSQDRSDNLDPPRHERCLPQSATMPRSERGKDNGAYSRFQEDRRCSGRARSCFRKSAPGRGGYAILSGEPETARLILRDLVNATLGFERLSKATATPSKSLHRMLSPKGNPSMDNLAAIFDAIRKCLKVGLRAHTVNLQKVA
jgi:DNA-binding phage protein